MKIRILVLIMIVANVVMVLNYGYLVDEVRKAVYEPAAKRAKIQELRKDIAELSIPIGKQTVTVGSYINDLAHYNDKGRDKDIMEAEKLRTENEELLATYINMLDSDVAKIEETLDTDDIADVAGDSVTVEDMVMEEAQAELPYEVVEEPNELKAPGSESAIAIFKHLGDVLGINNPDIGRRIMEAANLGISGEEAVIDYTAIDTNDSIRSGIDIITQMETPEPSSGGNSNTIADTTGSGIVLIFVLVFAMYFIRTLVHVIYIIFIRVPTIDLARMSKDKKIAEQLGFIAKLKYRITLKVIERNKK